MLKRDGIKASVLQLSQVWPFPGGPVAAFLGSSPKPAFTIENNATGQLANLIRAETGIKMKGSILKYDGRPFSPRDIAARLKTEVA